MKLTAHSRKKPPHTPYWVFEAEDNFDVDYLVGITLTNKMVVKSKFSHSKHGSWHTYEEASARAMDEALGLLLSFSAIKAHSGVSALASWKLLILLDTSPLTARLMTAPASKRTCRKVKSTCRA